MKNTAQDVNIKNDIALLKKGIVNGFLALLCFLRYFHFAGINDKYIFLCCMAVINTFDSTFWRPNNLLNKQSFVENITADGANSLRKIIKMFLMFAALSVALIYIISVKIDVAEEDRTHLYLMFLFVQFAANFLFLFIFNRLCGSAGGDD